MLVDQELFYVYILKSKEENRYYTGFSTDPLKRMEAHNRGKSNHTSKYTPWTMETLIGFNDVYKAKDFEKYLKSHSGRAFSSKHF